MYLYIYKQAELRSIAAMHFLERTTTTYVYKVLVCVCIRTFSAKMCIFRHSHTQLQGEGLPLISNTKNK